MFDVAGDVLKKNLMESILKSLEANLKSLVNTAFEAKLAATNSESKPENKYDTRGLEASYLAGAQAKRSKDLEKVIYHLKSLKLGVFPISASVDLTSIIQLSVDDQLTKYFFILPHAGGLKAHWNGFDFQVLTPESPLGSMLMGKKVGDQISLKIKNQNFEYEIQSLV